MLTVSEFKKEAICDSELLKLALEKLNTTKEELEAEYEKRRVELEDIKKRSKDFEKYCHNKFCSECYINEFRKHNDLSGLSNKICILIYEYLSENKEDFLSNKTKRVQ